MTLKWSQVSGYLYVICISVKKEREKISDEGVFYFSGPYLSLLKCNVRFFPARTVYLMTSPTCFSPSHKFFYCPFPGEDPGSKQRNVGHRLPNVYGQVWGWDCPNCTGDTGGTPESHHCAFDRWGWCTDLVNWTCLTFFPLIKDCSDFILHFMIHH